MKTYEITLLDNKTFAYMKTYTSEIIPTKGDHLTLEEDRIFIVKERLLATTDSNRIVLFGNTTTFKYVY